MTNYFDTGETAQSPERESLVRFLKLDTKEALEFDKSELRESLSALAREISSDGQEAESDTGDGTISMRWIKKPGTESQPSCVMVEGRTGGKFRSITLPLEDWGEGTPMSGIVFSLIEDGEEALHIPNSSDLRPQRVGDRGVERAVNGVKWIAGNLLFWNSGQAALTEKSS